MGNHSAKYIIGVKEKEAPRTNPKGSAPKYKNGREHPVGGGGIEGVKVRKRRG